MKKLVLILLLITTVAFHSNAQSYYFRRYQVEQGLSYNSVFDIKQDSKGFLWFASKDGLNRFDGYNFKIFRNNPSDVNSVGSNVTQAIFEDQKGLLWIGTSKGLYQYNDTTENFSAIKATVNQSVRTIKGDKAGNIYFLANGNVYKCDKNHQVNLYRERQENNVTSFVFSNDGALWLSTSDGFLRKYPSGKDTFTAFDVFNKSATVISHWIDKIYLTQANSILIGTSHQGVKLFDLQSNTYRDVLTFNPDRTSIYAKNFIHYEGDLYWVATESGVFVYNLRTGTHTNLKKNQGNPYALSDNAVYTFEKDQEGGIWVGTYFGGVNYYPKPFSAFDKFFPKNEVKSLSGNAIREICSDQYGNLWVATEDAGINKINKKTGSVTKYIPDGAKTSIAHTNIHGILAVKNELWIGTYEQGLDVLDIPSGKVIRHYDKGAGQHDLISNFIDCVYQTRNGDILIGSSFGVYRYNRSSNDFSLVQEFPENSHYMSLLEDEKGILWAGTINNGLLAYNPATKQTAHYKNQPGNNASISDDFVNALFLDRDKVLWISTENGLNRYDPHSTTFKRYGSKDGFPSNVMYRIEQDQAGKLWISTAKGLVCFHPKTLQLKQYTKSNGLLSDQFNYNSSFKDADGTLYFGSVNGMVGFNPSTFITNTLVPQVYITGFQVFNKELMINGKDAVLKKSITYTDRIQLAYDQSTFSIDFAALVYTDYETAEYAYKLEGIDKDYTYLKKNRKVFYTKLAPGTYTFLVKGANSSGIWNETPRKLVIEILPPFWRSTWAYLLYFILLAMASYLTVQYFNNKVKLKNKRKMQAMEIQKEHEIYEAKIDFFTNLIAIAETKPEEGLMEKLNDFIQKNLSDTTMDVDQLAENLNMSRATFYRKIKAISNLSPNELINITRLKKAAELLLTTDLKIQQIAHQTGFTSQAQFTRSFTKQFGITPSEYAQNKQA